MSEKDDSDLDHWADRLQAAIDEEEAKIFSQKVLEEARHPSNYGPMKDPDYELERTGTCGDSVRMYIHMEGDRISKVTFITDGCGATLACNSMLSKMAKGLTTEEAMSLTDDDLLEELGGLPDENLHCARLAVGTLYDAIKHVRDRMGPTS